MPIKLYQGDESLRINEVRLNNFGKFNNKTIRLEEGINLIYGDNEAGKSTIHTFVRGMLFGIDKLRGRASKDDTYLKYQPWDTPGAYNGSMDIEIRGKMYRILRNFDKSTKNWSIIELETGREINIAPEELKDLYGGLTEAGYRNTISIEQLKSRTDQELVAELRNYITNLSLSKSNEVDVTKALSFLQDRRKEMEAQQIDTKLLLLETEITEGLACEAKIDGLSIQLKEMEDRLSVLKGKKDIIENNLEEFEGFSSIEAYNAYLEQFPAIREKYRSYSEGLSQKTSLEVKQSALQHQVLELEEAQEENTNIKNNIVKIEVLKSKIAILEENKKILSMDKEKDIQKDKHKNVLYCLIPAIVSVLATLFFLGKSGLIVGIGSAIILLCVITYLYLSHQTHLVEIAFHQEFSEYEKEIVKLQTEESNIFLQQKVRSEHDLKKKQEEVLISEMSLEHLRKQKKDYEEQIMFMKEKLSTIHREILEYMKQSEGLFEDDKYNVQTLNDSVMRILEEHIVQQKRRITANQETTAKEYESSRIQMEKLKWELNALEGNEEKLLQNKELHKELLHKRNENEQELAAIKLAAQTINNLSVNIHDSFGLELNQLVSDLASEVTDGKYSDIKVDEKLNIKVGHKDNFVLLDKLSAGTIEQLYFALRIAISNSVYGEGVMPILLDDCFALYDDNRTKAALEALSRDIKGQVLLFTCHNREKTILDQLKINYHYINLSN